MLTNLRIRDFAILESAELTLGPGLTAITGETGAGKSILIEALALVLGGRGSERVIRHGRDSAEIEAQFDGIDDHQVTAILEEFGIASENGTLILRRLIGRNGARRCHVNGRLVTASQLQRLAAPLCDLSSQHAQHRLLDKQSHLEVLDRFAGHVALRQQHEERYGAVLKLSGQIEQIEDRQRRHAERLDYLRFIHKELTDLAVKPGEFAELQLQLARVKASEALAKATAEAVTLLEEDRGARDALGRAARALSRFAALDPKIADWAERALDLSALAADLGGEIQSYARTLGRDERKLAQLAERLDALHRAFRKYGGSEAALLQRQSAAAAELDTDAAQLELSDLHRELTRQQAELSKITSELSDRRANAAAPFAQSVETVIRQLGMPAAEFRVSLLLAPELRASGNEEVEFYLRANKGEADGPLVEIASGGELSRVLLAVQRACSDAVWAHHNFASSDEIATVTCIYDEADAGLSGSTGLVLGRFLAEIGVRQQVLCISHLPQVAAAADTHIRVVKSESPDGRTRSSLQILDADERLAEIARMLGALEGDADTAVAHARQLLAQQRLPNVHAGMANGHSPRQAAAH